MVKWKLNLNADTSLSFVIGEDEWTRMYFTQKGITCLLGADSYSVITSKLFKSFERLSSTVGEWERQRHVPSWVITLSETHTSLYLIENEEKINLLIQNMEGSLIGQAVVDSAILKLLRETILPASPSSWLLCEEDDS